MKVSAIIVFAAIIASAYAAAGIVEYTIFSESTCAQGNLIGIVSDIVADVTNCVGAYCEQIGTTGQYRTTACLTTRTTPPTNFIQWNVFSDNTCATASNYSAIVPNTCVQVRDVGAVKFQTCASGSFSSVQAATVADCNSNTNSITLTIDTSKCVDMQDGKTFTQGVCPAATPVAAPTAGSTPTSANTPVRAPARASSAASAALSVLSLAAGFVLAF